jgi:uncharacterized protein YyaL (SSP411 family)
VPTVAWEPWGRAAFARARAERKPVLLSIGAPWCAASLEMARTTYADPQVRELLASQFVCILIDADRRPDIAERYSLGGYPTTAFLAANGAIVGGGTFLSADRMRNALNRTADAFPSLPDAPVHVAAADTSTADVHDSPPDTDLDLRSIVFAAFDAEHGGFGAAPKFPLTAPIELALARYRESRDARMARIIETTLDAMGWGALYDEIDGGFFRCAASRDWNDPRREKLLDVNAALLRVYLDASTTLKIARYAERAADVVRYVQTHLADQADGGWAGSQAADDEYYVLSSEARRGRAAPPIDATFYAGANAAMASAMLQASAILNDAGLGEFAVRSLERVLLAAYRPGEGVAHYVDEGRPMVRGLLDDQIAMASAQLDAYEATGNVVYEMMAQELMHYALRTMWDADAGGFFDRSVVEESERVGLMEVRMKPFVANCEAARVLRRMSSVTGHEDFSHRAEATLTALEPLAGAQGPLAAHYLLARAKRPD